MADPNWLKKHEELHREFAKVRAENPNPQYFTLIDEYMKAPVELQDAMYELVKRTR